jgi:hypothetical protein
VKTARARIIKHEAVDGCESFEVRYADGLPSKHFYFDDLPSRRLRPETLDRATVLENAKAGGSEGCAGSLGTGGR